MAAGYFKQYFYDSNGKPINWDLLPYFDVLGITDFATYSKYISDVMLSDGETYLSSVKVPTAVALGSPTVPTTVPLG